MYTYTSDLHVHHLFLHDLYLVPQTHVVAVVVVAAEDSQMEVEAYQVVQMDHTV